MSAKWIGAVLVIAGCGAWGYSLAAAYRRQEKQLQQLIRAIQAMGWELQYRLTALPDLCRLAARECSGGLRGVFLDLARELNWNSQPDAGSCMLSVLKRYETLPPKIRRLLRHLGRVLGRYDLEGQLQGMETVLAECKNEVQGLGKDREIRLRSYQTLGLCAGAALTILFI